MTRDELLATRFCREHQAALKFLAKEEQIGLVRMAEYNPRKTRNTRKLDLFEGSQKKKPHAANKLEKMTGVDVPYPLDDRYRYGALRTNVYKPSIRRELTSRGVQFDEAEGIHALLAKLKNNEGGDGDGATFKAKTDIVACGDG